MSKFRAVIVTATAVLSCVFSVWVTFLVMEAKYKKEKSFFETYNYIDVGTWVKTNDDYNRYVGKRIAGKVADLRDVRGEAYPVATLEDGRKISIFWLVRMKTQRR